MRCKCGYNSFDYNLTCPKCHRDLSALRTVLNLSAPNATGHNFFLSLNQNSGLEQAISGQDARDSTGLEQTLATISPELTKDIFPAGDCISAPDQLLDEPQAIEAVLAPSLEAGEPAPTQPEEEIETIEAIEVNFDDLTDLGIEVSEVNLDNLAGFDIQDITANLGDLPDLGKEPSEARPDDLTDSGLKTNEVSFIDLTALDIETIKTELGNIDDLDEVKK